MAIGKKLGSTIKDIIDPNAKKKNKGKDFMTGLKDFFTSPGGIAVLLLFAITMWYIHHSSTAKAK